MREFEKSYLKFKEELSGFDVFEEYRDDRGDHPENFRDYECRFAADQIARFIPESILDIGSYRHFLMGLMAHHRVTTIDIRNRKQRLANETVITCDAARLDLLDDSFEAVLSLCALEHMGLGRYGDPVDLYGDKKAFEEMVRVLKPGGVLIFTTTIHNAPPAVAFNAHRIYNHQTIKDYCTGLVLVEEKFFSHELAGACSLNQITNNPRLWDIYCGCWRSPTAPANGGTAHGGG
jgi:SAM-dependent methyltransferase